MVPYMNLPNAKEAIELYKNIFDAKVLDHRPFTKEQAPPGRFPDDFDFENSTMYAYVEILGQKVHISDGSPDLSPNGMVDIYFDLDNEQQIKKIYNKAQAAGCTITVPLAKQFWGAVYTNFKDPVGITWQLSAPPDPEPEEEPAEVEATSTAKKTTAKKSSSKKSPSKKTTKKGKKK